MKRIENVSELIKAYKARISQNGLENEKYKWELIKTYKGRPNTDVEDFTNELKQTDYKNLIYPMAKAVIVHISKEKPEETKKLFNNLFDESRNLTERVNQFNENALKLYRTFDPKSQHHQDERSISNYLTLKYPEKYTFYKSSFYKKYCELLGIKPAKKNEKFIHYLQLINELIEDHIIPDKELVSTVKGLIPDLYDGSNNLLLAQDILYQVFDQTPAAPEDLTDKKYWIYSPGELANKWDEFYDQKIMALDWDKIGDFKQFNSKKEIQTALRNAYGGEGSLKNNVTSVDEFANKMNEGDIVIVKKGRSELIGYGIVNSDYFHDDERDSFKACRKVNWKLKGNWNLDFQVVLKTLTDITGYSKEDKAYPKYLMDIMQDKEQKPNIKFGSLNTILFGPPGTGKTYRLQKEYFPLFTTTEDSISAAQHFTQLIENLSWWQVVGIALLEKNNASVSDLISNRWVSKKAGMSESKNVRATIWGTLQMHTINESTTVNYKQRQPPLIFNKNKDKSWHIIEEETRETAPELFEHLKSVTHFKPSSDKLIKRYEFITFHQSYAYEDFIEGIKPVMTEDIEEQGDLRYEIKSGVFKEMCKRADNDPENSYALFIDEINRGNVSQIFGELITLIEDDKRKGMVNELSLVLPYSRKAFWVPKNLHIFGTMNTADRSVEALDTALRRRFSFVEMPPTPALINEVGKTENGKINGIELASLLEIINRRIEKLLDKDHLIGHSYFLTVETIDGLKAAFQNKIIPLLQEYFFGDYGKIGLVIGSAFFDIKEDKQEDDFFAPFEDYDSSPFLERKVYQLKNITEMSDDEFTIALTQLVSKTRN